MKKLRTQQGYYRRIARVIEAILADPAAPHTVESLASVAHFSPFHFHRIYRAMTGEGVAETVRRLRMAQAAWQLTEDRNQVIEVALEAGYESPQAFARAFRGFTGLSPSSFQAKQQELDGTISSAQAPAVDLVKLAPFTVHCIRHDGPVATISMTYRRLYHLLGDRLPKGEVPGQIGISMGDPDGGDSFVYWAGMAVDDPNLAIEGLETVQVEGGLYACLRLRGPFALIGPMFRALYGRWLPQSGFEPENRPSLEFYRSPTGSGKSAEHEIDLMIPIKEA